MKVSDLDEKQRAFMKQFVLGVCDCSIFTSAQTPDHTDVNMVFLPVALGALNPQIEDLPPRPQPPDPEKVSMGYIPKERVREHEAAIAAHDLICEAAFKATRSRVGVIWEYWEKALPRSVNGLPCFLSYQIMSPEMWQIAYKLIDAEMKRRDALQLDDLLGDEA